MRRALSLAVLALAGAAVAGGGSPGPAKLKAQFEAIYAKIGLAFAKKDAKGYARWLAPDYGAGGKDGKTVMNRAQTIRDITGQMRSLEHIVWKRTVRRVALHGATATVLVDGHLTAEAKAPGEPAHSIVFDGSSSDLWARNGGSWRLRHSTILKASMSMDGRVVQHM